MITTQEHPQLITPRQIPILWESRGSDPRYFLSCGSESQWELPKNGARNPIRTDDLLITNQCDPQAVGSHITAFLRF